MRIASLGACAALVLTGCTAQEFTAQCSSDGEATHDFGTTDLATLARVSAFAQSTLNANETEAQVPVRVVGSVGVVNCDGNAEKITFVLEPE